MKIVTKHVDNFRSTSNKNSELVPKYLVYLMTDDDISVRCDIAYGKLMRDTMVSIINIGEISKQKDIGLTLPTHHISLEEFKNNLVLNN